MRANQTALLTKLAGLARWDLVAAHTHDECICGSPAAVADDSTISDRRVVGKMSIGTFSLHRRERMRELHRQSPRAVGGLSSDCVYSCACGRGDLSCADTHGAAQLVVQHDLDGMCAAERVPIGVVAPAWWLQRPTPQVRRAPRVPYIEALCHARASTNSIGGRSRVCAP